MSVVPVKVPARRRSVFEEDFDVMSGYRLSYSGEFPTVRFAATVWDFTSVPDIPKGLARSYLVIDWSRVDSRWRLLVKELLAAMLCPLHPAVVALPQRRQWPLPFISLRLTVSQVSHWLEWLHGEGIGSLEAVTQQSCDGYLSQFEHNSPGADEIFPCAGQRPKRLSLVRVGLEHPEAVVVGARQLAQNERVKPVGLAAGDTKPIARGRDLVGMQGQHPQPRVQQPLDQQAIRPLDRDQLNPQPHQLPAQRPQPLLVMGERGRQQHLARRISDEHVVLLRRPVNAGVTSHLYSSSVRTNFTAPRPGGTVADAHRQALEWGYVLSPLRGTSPPPGGAGLLSALARASSAGPLPTAVEANNRMAYEQRGDCRQLRALRLAHRPGDAAVPPGAARLLSAWQGSRLAPARETNASLQMPTGWTGSAAIASAMALTGRGPVSSSESHPRNPRDAITRTAEPRQSAPARGVGRRVEKQ